MRIYIVMVNSVLQHLPFHCYTLSFPGICTTETGATPSCQVFINEPIEVLWLVRLQKLRHFVWLPTAIQSQVFKQNVDILTIINALCRTLE